MDYKQSFLLLKKNKKKVKDFTFATAFFLIFSIFVLFAIRPNLITAFELRNELENLRVTDAEYERLIQLIVEHESTLGRNLQNLYVLDEAIPSSSAQTHKLFEDFRSISSATSLPLQGIIFPPLSLIAGDNQPKGLQKIELQLTSFGSKQGIDNLLTSLTSQRRLKDIEKIDLKIAEDQEASQVAIISLTTEVSTYYYR